MVSKLRTVSIFSWILVFIFHSKILLAQAPEINQGYQFESLKRLKATTVKDQYKTSTCWSFSGISMLESELLRLGKEEKNLSEMFVVRCAYEEKAKKYVRMHGTVNFAGGGAFNDVTDVIRKYGIVPEEVYPGLKPGQEKHDHIEMDAKLKHYVDHIIKNSFDEISPDWFPEYCELLDEELGEVPDIFTYEGETYTPVSFAKELALSLDEYVLITSFNHHPFYGKFILEVPDNWSWEAFYNVPMEELIEIIDYSLEQGYTVAWAADISEKGFSKNHGLALVPEKNTLCDSSTSDSPGSSSVDQNELNKTNFFEYPVKEMNITQDLRQHAFNTYSTTDDHAMHITGMNKDLNDKKYYLVKNSWGTESGPYGGYFYASQAYIKYKTTSIMVNKNALPAHIAEKLDLLSPGI